MKTLVLEVTCIEPEFDQAPDYFIIDLNEQFIRKVKRLASIVKENDAYSIEFFDHSGEYLSISLLEDITSNHDLDEVTEIQVANASEETYRATLKTVVVTEGSFKFTCIPKHCDDHCACSTAQVSLDELDIFYKSKSAQKVLKLMDSASDGAERYSEFVAIVAKEDKIPVEQVNKELEPFV